MTDRLTIIDRGLLRRIQKRVAALAHEHILIYSSNNPPRQVWQWAIRCDDGRKLRHREHPFFSESPPRPLLDRLAGLEFRLEEEEELSLTDALERVRRALDTTAELNLFVRYPSYAKRSDALAEAMINGDAEAFHRFVLFHRRLVDWVARRYARLLHLDLEDAQQIGVLGLLHAAKRFDPSRGVRFSTFGTYCIQGFCKRLGLPSGQLIRISPHVYWPCIKVRQKLQRAAAEGPTAVEHVLARLQGEDIFLANCWSDFQRALEWKSLSNPRQPEYQQARELVDPDSGPFRNAVHAEQVERIRAIIGRLPHRQAQIIRYRYGIQGPALTLAEIGQRFQITRERVRQIQAAAEERLHRYILAEMPSMAAETGREESEPTDAQPQVPSEPQSMAV